MKSSWVIQEDPKSNDKCLHKRQKRRSREKRGEIHVQMKTEVGVAWTQTKECLEPTEPGRSKEGLSLGASDVTFADTLIWTLALRSVRK